MEIIEKAPAKINLSLDALFEHSDGLQEWQMVMTSIDLADYITIKPREDAKITVSTNSGFLPVDARNLAHQAALILQKKMNISIGADIYIQKKIPVAAGLGGGSSDAAAVLRGLNRLWNLELSLDELAVIGLEVDSDVPYCVYSKTSLVSGKGEKITPLPLLPSFWLVIAKPKVSVSTPKILNEIEYDRIDHPQTEALVSAIHAQNYQKMTQNMRNVLEPITSKKYPEIAFIKNKMLRFGADVAQMSGTGPTVFGICAKRSRAQRVFNSMKGFCQEVYLVHVIE